MTSEEVMGMPVSWRLSRVQVVIQTINNNIIHNKKVAFITRNMDT